MNIGIAALTNEQRKGLWTIKDIKIGITFIFRFHCSPIQLVVFVPGGLSSFLRAWQPTRPTEDVVRMTKGLQEQI